MSVTLNVTVEDIAAKLLAGYTRIELYRATSAEGTYSSVSNTTLVADTVYYEITDASGSLDSWYKYRFSDAAALLSDYTNPLTPDGITRRKLRREALETYRAGMVLTASASGQTTTSLFFDDYRLKSSGYGGHPGVGAWIYVVSGTLTGQRRLITDSDPATGELAIDIALASELASGDLVELHWLIEPDEWNLAINRALHRYKVVERVPVVGIDAVETPLDYLGWLRSRAQVCGIWHYPVEGNQEIAFGSSGRWWGLREDGGYLTLLTQNALESTTTVYLEALKTLTDLFTDDSVLPANCNLDLVAALAYDEVLKTLLRPSNTGRSQERLLWRQARADHLPLLKRLWTTAGPHPRWQAPPLEYPVTYPQPWSAR